MTISHYIYNFENMYDSHNLLIFLFMCIIIYYPVKVNKSFIDRETLFLERHLAICGFKENKRRNKDRPLNIYE